MSEETVTIQIDLPDDLKRDLRYIADQSGISVQDLFIEAIEDAVRHRQSQPYQLGLKLKRLGEKFMDPYADLRELVELAGKVGLRIRVGIETGEAEDE